MAPSSLPRLHTLFLALVTALLLVAGIIGVYSVQAASFRDTLREAQAYDQSATIDATDLNSDGPPFGTMPGAAY